LITLPGAHHHLPLERPDEVALAIQNFARAHPV
jgi:pimeloyl-ACP methyl ester carboxylesterase